MTEYVLVSVCCIDLRMSALNEALPHPIPAMSNSADHDRRALGIAAETLRNLANDHLYSDAFRHRIMAFVPHAGTGAVVQLLLLSTAARLDAMAERMTPPETPAERLARIRVARKAAERQRGSLPD